MHSYEQRVLDAVQQGYVRPAQIVRVTCLNNEHVKRALSQLRKQRKIEMCDGTYKLRKDDSNG